MPANSIHSVKENRELTIVFIKMYRFGSEFPLVRGLFQGLFVHIMHELSLHLCNNYKFQTPLLHIQLELDWMTAAEGRSLTRYAKTSILFSL